jgi:hypothetical protein
MVTAIQWNASGFFEKIPGRREVVDARLLKSSAVARPRGLCDFPKLRDSGAALIDPATAQAGSFKL